jgi:hypothetical protein
LWGTSSFRRGQIIIVVVFWPFPETAMHFSRRMEDDDALTGTLGGSVGGSVGLTSSDPTTPPPREEFVQNAVAFLRHPQVVNSSAQSKRGFLEKKGLTSGEIAEAFARVPQAVGDVDDATTNERGDAGNSNTQNTLTTDTEKHPPLRWTQVVARTGAAVAAMSFVWRTFRPKNGGRNNPAPGQRNNALLNESADASAATRAAAAERNSLALQEAVAAAAAASRDAAEARAAVDNNKFTAADVSLAVEKAKSDLRQELEQVVAHAVADATRRGATFVSSSGDDARLDSAASPELIDSTLGVRRELAAIKAMLASSPLVSANAGVGVGEEASRVTPRMRADGTVVPAPGTTPRSALASSSSRLGAFYSRDGPSTPNGDVAGTHSDTVSSPPTTPTDPPHPASYKDVLDMLDKGLTPPGIRDIDDKPPDPSAALPEATAEVKKKPWENETGLSGLSSAWPLGGGAAASENQSSVSRNHTPWQPRSNGKTTAVPWVPPSVPSLSAEASQVLIGRGDKNTKGATSGTYSDTETDTFGGFDSPVPSGSGGGVA